MITVSIAGESAAFIIGMSVLVLLAFTVVLLGPRR